MDIVLIVAACLALVAVAVLCFTAVSFLNSARGQVDRVVASVERAASDLHQLRVDMAPVLKQSETLLVQLKDTADQVDRELEKIGRGADAFARIADDIRGLEQLVVSRLRGPISDVTGVVAGITRGITAFVRKLGER